MTHKNSDKPKKKIISIFAFCLLLFFGVSTNSAQQLEVKIKVLSANPLDSRVRVEGRILEPKSLLAGKDWSFLRDYADVSDLGARIENLSLFGENNEKLEIKKLIDGEFQAVKTAVSFAYDLSTTVPSRPTSAAHISWISGEQGVLMLNDLLPQWNREEEPVSAKVNLSLPAGWKVTGIETPDSAVVFEVKNLEKAVFLIGKNWREQTVKVDKTELNLATTGEWQFSDEEAGEMATSILEEYHKIFGEVPAQRVQVLLLPFPQKTSQIDRWRAETRGSTVTILSGAIPLKSQALQRLHEQLRHEIFHLWLPNKLALTGNYDWFYEGFTIYQALRTGVETNQIRFDDYLNTLARAYDLSQNQTASLVEMSNKRWMGGGNSVYARGMIVAFLCDAALVSESGGKRSVSEVFRRIYQKHRAPNQSQDGNAAILKILKSYPELVPVVQRYIEGNAKIEWQAELNKLGVESVINNGSAELKVLPKLTGRQKDLLNELGYNQWRKLLRKTKR